MPGQIEAPAIEIAALTKRYGATTAVDNLSISVPSGAIFGLLGTNGAGKTTTFKCALGLARPTEGEVRFGGQKLQPQMFESLSYMPERPALYDWMTGAQHLTAARQTFARYDDARARELAELFGLDLRKRAGKLSKGQQSALGLVLAFAIRPAILVLDEPSSGLDPVHQRHVLERAADRVAVLHRGKLVLQGLVEDLKEQEKIVEATFDGDAPAIAGLEANPSVRHLMRQGRLLRAYVRGTGDGVVAAIQAASPTSVRILDQNLEDIFLVAVGGN